MAVSGLTAVVAGTAAMVPAAEAAEGASSHYLPGVVGDLGLAFPPTPGWTVSNTVWVQAGKAEAAPLQGRVDLGLDLTSVLNLTAASYTRELPGFAATYTASMLIPFGYAELQADVVGPAGNRVSASGDSFNLSDVAFSPLQFNWAVGRWSFKAAQVIIAPTGAYDVDKTVNLGRNYWSFDTVAAVTWFHPDTGTEISAAPGIMFNTKNNATDYKTGTEFHLDFNANQFVTPSLALGLRGYWYEQLTADSGASTQLGDFKSSSFGLGLGFVWTPTVAGAPLILQGKWLHDLTANNRFDSNYGLLTVARQF